MKLSYVRLLMVASGLCAMSQIRAMEGPATSELEAKRDVELSENLEVATVFPTDDQRNNVLVIAVARYEKALERKSSLGATPVTLEIARIDKADKNVGTEENNDKDETLSASSEHFSAEVEVGKRGGWFHCKTHCKSKTVAKYVTTAAGGLLAGLLL